MIVLCALPFKSQAQECLPPDAATFSPPWVVGTDQNGSYLLVPNGIGGRASDSNTVWVEYSFYVAPGQYNIHVLVAPTNQNDNSFFVSVDGSAGRVFDLRIGTLSWQAIGPYSLTLGLHSIRIGWREDGTKFYGISLLSVGRNPNANPPNCSPVGWSLPISVSAASQTDTLTIGGSARATADFDSGIDVPAPPPGFGYYAYLSVPVQPGFLSADFRQWTPPFEAIHTWTIRIVNAAGVTSTLNWNPALLPPEGRFQLIRPGGLPPVEMRSATSAIVVGSATLNILYRFESCWTKTISDTGWYQISLPVIPDSGNLVTQLFPTADLPVYGWNFASLNYDTVTALVDTSASVWVHFSSPTTLQVCGTKMRSFSRPYPFSGWDMVGSVSDTARASSVPDASLAAMFQWNTVLGTYVAISSRIVKPGSGSWILMGQPGTFTVGAGTSLGKSFFESGLTPPPPPFAMTGVGGNTREIVPNGYALEQNYPNPFNPTTQITYRLPRDGYVSLKVFDLTGREVATLIDGIVTAGEHAVDFDASRLANGVYFYRLKAGEFASVRRMVLVK